MGIIRQVRALPLPPAGTPGVFSLADACLLERTFMPAGITAVHTQWLTVTPEYGAVQEFMQERQATSANTRAMLAKVSVPERPSGV
jgi:hypothetical protein